MNIKCTPLILFLFFLLVLVISIVFSKYLPAREGFISFADSKSPLDPVFIPTYSGSVTSVVKLYDNAFFDMRNANLIEVNGSVTVSSNNDGNVVGGNVDGNVVGGNVVSGNAVSGNVSSMPASVNGISKIYVLKRDDTNAGTEYTAVLTESGTVVPVETPESQIASTPNSYVEKLYSTRSNETDKYQIVYIAWGTHTYMHIIRLGSAAKHVAAYMTGANSQGHIKMYPESTISIGAYTDDTDASNGKYVSVPLYDGSANIYQLNKSVRYDQRNGNLVIFDRTANTVKVYGRNGGETTSKPTSVSVAAFEPWLVNDANNNMVIYFPFDKKTVIAVLQMDPTNSSKFILGKVARFNNDGALENATTSTTTPATTTPTPTPNPDDPMSEFYKWMAYWNIHILYEDKSDDDYIRKTQIVPPVCPSCPSCPSCPNSGAGICTNCGGNGGCGTLKNDGTSSINNNRPLAKLADRTGDVIEQTVQSTGDVATKAISTTGDVLKTTGTEVGSLVRSAGSGTADILKSTASGTTDLLKSAASGTTDLLKSTATGTTDILKSTATGTTDLLKSAGTGAVGLLKSAGTGATSVMSPSHPNYGQRTIYPQGAVKRTGETQRVPPAAMYKGQSLGPSDYYSMYGATQPKGDQFIPVTADFSAFRK